jgi:hypothetical protein
MRFDLTHVLSSLKLSILFMELAELPTQREKMKRLFVYKSMKIVNSVIVHEPWETKW